MTAQWKQTAEQTTHTLLKTLLHTQTGFPSSALEVIFDLEADRIAHLKF
ncbi:MAG: hypothetical protein MZV64_56245 [Ignavibacteriales bacterium]|nr:hypothetical protein [Ignavibacteriales bacterium]